MEATKRVQGLVYYKTDRGLIVGNRAFVYGNVRSDLHGGCLVNDKKLDGTHSKYWYFLPDETEIVSYKEKVADAHVLKGYTLKDPEMFVEGKIPLQLSVDDVKQYYDDDEDQTMWEHHNNIRPLYEPVYEKVVGGYQEVEFEAECKGVVEGDLERPIETTFRVKHDGAFGSGEVKPVKLENMVHYGELDRILTPEFAIHNKPCALTSKQTYDIIRTFVKDHIDPKEAIITSDYDFCFTVKKKVAVKPWVRTTEQKTRNGRSYRTPKYKNQTIDHKQVEVFEMTHGEKGYQNYTVIKGFTANNLKELVDVIKVYLEELVGYINNPVSECEHCRGTGHMVVGDFDKNKR